MFKLDTEETVDALSGVIYAMEAVGENIINIGVPIPSEKANYAFIVLASVANDLLDDLKNPNDKE